MKATGVDILYIFEVLLVRDRTEELVGDYFGKSDYGIQWGPQLVAHIGEEVALRAAGQFGLTARFDQFSLRCLDVRNVRVDRDHGAVRHGSPTDLQQPAGRRYSLLYSRHIAIKQVETPGNLPFRFALTKISANRLEHQDVMKRRIGAQVGWQIEQFAKPRIPCDQPSPTVEHAQALPDIFERALKQRVPALQPQLGAHQTRRGKLLAPQGAS